MKKKSLLLICVLLATFFWAELTPSSLAQEDKLSGNWVGHMDHNDGAYGKNSLTLKFQKTGDTSEELWNGAELNNIANLSVQTGNWGAWSESSQFSGLDSRVKCGVYNDKAKKQTWYVQFRNRYQKKIHFSYKMADPSEKVTRTTLRTSLRSGAQSPSDFALLNTSCGDTVAVYVNQVRFGEVDSGPYVTPNQKLICLEHVVRVQKLLAGNTPSNSSAMKEATEVILENRFTTKKQQKLRRIKE